MIYLSDDEMKAILQSIPINAADENKFFEDLRFFPGRWSDLQSKKVFQPQESFRIYEHILSQINRVDPERYATMHKGTPFYMMGWLAYEMKDYERGVFYMDAALSEDFNNAGPNWMALPAASFLFLDETNKGAAAHEITVQMRKEVIFQLERFSKNAGDPLYANTLINQFYKPQAKDSAYRSILTSMLTFLLEGRDLRLNLKLRSSYGGTLEPFLTHLFKGGLIFESLLKRKYGTAGRTLGNYLAAAKTDLHLNCQLYKRKDPYQFEELPSLMQDWKNAEFQERTVATAYAVRNTSGHNLAWRDIFTVELYLELFEGIADAIFWTIKKAYKI